MKKLETINVLVKNEQTLSWTQREISPCNGLQTVVNGSIECVSLPHHIDLWVNDEGLLHPEMIVNLILIWDEDPQYHQPIFGPVALAGVNDEGETISLNDQQRKWLADHLRVGILHNGNPILAIDLTDGGAIA